ncbi:hypothetical protein BOO71_0008170 [Deinococcus marmoris]|uniref:Uncharacterized protein n=1 Tax=Deinococcus marmoris TaxID=249408 RepID=A0A1U7NXY6_9DEIO|nr:hypothetical protein BOO71_0008170 [Deinococcus marmoris]
MFILFEHTFTRRASWKAEQVGKVNGCSQFRTSSARGYE